MVRIKHVGETSAPEGVSGALVMLPTRSFPSRHDPSRFSGYDLSPKTGHPNESEQRSKSFGFLRLCKKAPKDNRIQIALRNATIEASIGTAAGYEGYLSA